MLSPLRVAMNHLNASEPEKEVEQFLKALLPGTPYAGKVKAVGGYVRDEYLSLIKNDPSIESKDLDLVVDMEDGGKKLSHFIYDVFNRLWDKMKQFFTNTKSPISRPRQMGKGYPIWQITFKDDITFKGKTYKTNGAVIDIAATMKESYPDESSRQRKTEPGTLKEDIARRDFTVNQLLKDMTTGEIEDFTGTSKQDIEKGVLKGHPDVPLDQMFANDPLRMIRLFRFQAKYGWDIPLFVLKAVKRNAKRIEIVSAERIMGELEKVMKYGKLKSVIKLMSATGLLKYILPEVEALKGVQQNPEYHSEGDVYRHTLKVLENAPPGVENQIAALLHDIGKPGTTKIIEDKIKSKGHEELGADIAEAMMKRLKFDNATTDKVKKMVRNHMRPHTLGPDPSIKAIRKFVREVGDEMVDCILDLARADEIGKIPPSNAIPDLKKKIEEVRKQPEQTKKGPILKGDEIMDLLGIKQGPEVGKAMNFLTDLGDEYAEKKEELTKEKAREELLKKFKKQSSVAGELKRMALSLQDAPE